MKKTLIFIVLLIMFISSIEAQNKKELKSTIENQLIQLEGLNSKLLEINSELNISKSKNNELQADNLNLREGNKKLETEISKLVEKFNQQERDLEAAKLKLESYINGPQNRLADANQQFELKDYKAALILYNELQLIYPTSSESVLALNKISEINKIQAKLFEEEKRKNDEKNLDISRDEFKKRTFYEDKRGARYHHNFAKLLDPDLKLNLYFSIPFNSNKAEALRFTVGYSDDNWLFIRKATFLIDGKQYDIIGEFERDSGNGGVYEWLHSNATGRILTIIKAIINSSSAEVRFEGDKYYSDVSVNEEQKEALRNIYNLYKSKGGI